ncbi:MAG TPA: hypothetical protein VFT06_15585 [Flavisolibacter sp.]|nr:hypothetical protein [Flavisolibacter sp.]
MELNMTGGTTIRNMKAQFSCLFSHLKIEIDQEFEEEEVLANAKKSSDGLRLGKTCHLLKEGVFVFTPSMSVAEFKRRLQKEFGLAVQVFRSEGNLWVGTLLTDNLSLAKQNMIGRLVSKPFRFNMNSLFL